MNAILITNGPGELYTWAKPVLQTLQSYYPEVKIIIGFVPCQFASGHEARIAQSFEIEAIITASEFVRFLSLGTLPKALEKISKTGFVLSLGGNTKMALRLAGKLGYPIYRYSFIPYWHSKLRILFVNDNKSEKKARWLGAPKARVKQVGNLVADATFITKPITKVGKPHVLLMFGSRDIFALPIIPFMCALVDKLGKYYPKASFTAPISHLLSRGTLETGIAGTYKDILGGVASQQKDNTIITPNGQKIELVPEEDRYAHMRSATIAVTIPGTNTLELGIAGVPSIVILPLNKPEIIPLEGPAHWLSLIPLIGTILKRYAVKLAAPHLPVSLPNYFTGEDLMLEIKGILTLDGVVEKICYLLDNTKEYKRRKTRLLETMPKQGAAKRLVNSIMNDLQYVKISTLIIE